MALMSCYAASGEAMAQNLTLEQRMEALEAQLRVTQQKLQAYEEKEKAQPRTVVASTAAPLTATAQTAHTAAVPTAEPELSPTTLKKISQYVQDDTGFKYSGYFRSGWATTTNGGPKSTGGRIAGAFWQ